MPGYDPRMMQMGQAGLGMLAPRRAPGAAPPPPDPVQEALAQYLQQQRNKQRAVTPGPGGQGGQPGQPGEQKPMSLLDMMGGASSPMGSVYQSLSGLPPAAAAVGGSFASPWAFMAGLGGGGSR